MVKRNVGYYPNWSVVLDFKHGGIYDKKFTPDKIPVQDLTHLLYAFGNTNKDTGEVYLSDSWADVEIHYPGDSWNDSGTNLYGNFKALYLLKKRNRNLKVLLSIGGWTFSPNFANIANASWRQTFVRTAVKLVEDVGLDGLDIDYEYPSSPSDAQGYVSLLQELRQALNNLATSKGRQSGQYQLTIAAPCGLQNMQILRIAEMDRCLDFWNLMAYDFAGSWSQVTGHQANLYADNANDPSVDNAVKYYMRAGVPSFKLVIGMPLYGRSFLNTNGVGQPFYGVGETDGSIDYKDLPKAGATEMIDRRLVAAYSYDQKTRQFISYETPESARLKFDYINRNTLGGAMFWELSEDAGNVNPRGLVKLAKQFLQGGLEYRQNELGYQGSKYDNLRAGMPGQ